MDAGWDPHLRPCIEGGKAGIAAGADDTVGCELPEYLFAFLYRAENTFDRVHILFQSGKILSTAQAGAGKASDLVPRLGH